MAQLLFLQSESNKKPIHIYINSPGKIITLETVFIDLKIIKNNAKLCYCISGTYRE